MQDNELRDYWPKNFSTKVYDDLPKHIALAAGEIDRCLQAGAPRAAAAMTRTLVEAVAKDHNITKGNLQSKIEALAAAGLIGQELKEAVHEIRFLGNEAAHADFDGPPITMSEAQESAEWTDLLLDRIYQEPARVARLLARRAQRRASGGGTPAPG
ncbi:DUF4145 domain-containing protein [Microtetraspora sp. NBRC 16547]|uniref:DUF4145 domain-containing protein n=1 Tax=Microtetraspora sp. NBRC 16547 TaxID=3030993 RepID=UPI00249FDF01|nr:DUF4145 domain-containing protein [Microtetraspora sp. NBRC 16547]GLW96086.1 hypothetical protein Misp02_01730 [Microtetraspora sp. NBRC 16547]